MPRYLQGCQVPAKHGRKGSASGNTRNGSSQTTLKREQGHVAIEVPHDRQGTFEPQLVKKGQTRLEGFDDKILALYARGITTRDIQAQLQELYGVEVSPTLISNVTEQCWTKCISGRAAL